MAEENISKMKREPTVQENIFANDISDKGLSPKCIKNSHNPTYEDKQINSKMGKGLEQTLLQGRHTEGPEIHEKMLSIPSHQRDANENHN